MLAGEKEKTGARRGSEIGYLFFSSRRQHTRYWRDWSSDVCSSDLSKFPRATTELIAAPPGAQASSPATPLRPAQHHLGPRLRLVVPVDPEQHASPLHPEAATHTPRRQRPAAPYVKFLLLADLHPRQVRQYLCWLYYAVTEGCFGEVFGRDSIFHGQAANAGAAQGREVGAGLEVVREVGDQGPDVGAAGAGDLEGGALPGGVEREEEEREDGDGTGVAVDGDAAGEEVMED